MCRSLAFLVLKPLIKAQFLGQLELPGAKLPDLLPEDSGYFLKILISVNVGRRQAQATDGLNSHEGLIYMNSGQNVVFCVLMIEI